MGKEINKIKAYCRSFYLSVLFVAGMFGVAQAELERHPIAVGTNIDFGQIIKGGHEAPPDSIADGQIITRTGVYLTQSGTYNERLTLAVSVGGLFWYPLPERIDFETRIIRFGPGVGQAQASYVFGQDPEDPFAKLQMGLFPLKYNPDAKNLGEYLFRSGTYPGLLYTGGWSYMNSAAYMAQGLRFTWNMLDGMLVHDFSLTMERDMEPTHDLSPAYMLTFSPTSFFDLGLGAIWAHGIPVKPDSILAPKSNKNAYVKATGLPLAYNDTSGEMGRKHYSSTDSRVKADGDSCLVWGTSCYDAAFVSVTGNGIPGELIDHYTFRGIKAMTRFSLDFGEMFGMTETMGENTFKLYGELALLGWKNQPFFYDKKPERMPVMFGLNIPTFKLLDMLCLEVEYRKSRFPNTTYFVFEQMYPLPITEISDYSVYDLDAPRYADTTHAEFQWLESDPGHTNPTGFRDKQVEEWKKDDWKWSVYARRQITEGLTLYAQAASDHLRHIIYQVRPMYTPTTQRPSEWYFLLRLEMGI
jgi:hypothetical protein